VARVSEPVFDALGRRFVVRCVDPGVEAHVWDLLDGLRVGTADPEGLAVLSIDLTAADPATVVRALVGTVNLWAVAAAEGKLLLHAGGVADGNGATIVLCGPSGSGKSTLTAALVGDGLAYVTDEMVCLGAETMRISPFRKPLSLKPGSFAALPRFAPEPGSVAERCTGAQWLVPPQTLGGPSLPAGALYPSLIVFPTHVSGGTLSVEPVRPAEAAYVLGSNSAGLWWASGGSLGALARLARWAPAYRLVYGSSGEAVEAITKLAAEAA
jgi:hypothetical protein